MTKNAVKRNGPQTQELILTTAPNLYLCHLQQHCFRQHHTQFTLYKNYFVCQTQMQTRHEWELAKAINYSLLLKFFTNRKVLVTS